MEFGLFNQMYHPIHRRAERTEYDVLREELALIEVADRVGFKYAWARASLPRRVLALVSQ